MNRRKMILSLWAGGLVSKSLQACNSAQKVSKTIPDQNEQKQVDTFTAPEDFVVLSPEGRNGHLLYSKNGRTGELYMQIVKTNTLTITDLAWHNPLPKGYYKKWKIDETDWQQTPLQNIKLSEAYRGKPISIEVVVFSEKSYIYPVKIYQQLIMMR
jgi:hypothetical protein